MWLRFGCQNYIDNLKPNDLPIFKRWIERYINNWAKCDGFCNHTIGDLIQKYPEIAGEVKNWAKAIIVGLNGLLLFRLLFLQRKAVFCKMLSKLLTHLLSDER